MWQRTTIAVLVSLCAAHAAFGFACIKSSPTDGSQPQCIHWDQHAATVDSFLGVPSNPPLANGTVTWDQNVMGAANDWNSSGADFHFNVTVGGQFINPCGAAGGVHTCTNTGPIGNNPVLFADTFCGQGFGDILELVNDCWVQNTAKILNAPVFVNSTVSWNAYNGALFPGGQPVYDIRRVLLHELGHVAGLDHPDEQGQNVAAIMNSRVSNLFQLQPDDISGMISIYSGGSQPPPSDGSSPGPSSGCQVDAAPRQRPGWGAVLPAMVAALLLGRRRRSGASATR